MQNKLTTKQKLFIIEYTVDGNATQAAKRAGYSERSAYSTGQRLLKNAVIAEALANHIKKRSDEVDIDLQWILDRAVATHLKCSQEEPVLDKDGNETGEYKFDSTGANKALELAGKHVFMNAFKDRLEVNMKPRVIIKDMAGGKLVDTQGEK